MSVARGAWGGIVGCLVACAAGPERVKVGTLHQPTDSTDSTDSGERFASPGSLTFTPGPACAAPEARGESSFDLALWPQPSNRSLWLWGMGVVAADLDGASGLEVVLPGEGGARLAVLGSDGRWAFPKDPFPGVDLGFGVGGSAADYDGDGDLDLFISRYARPDVLLRNEGGLRFVDATSGAGVGGGRRRSMGSAWADFDRDGDLDLVVAGYGAFDESGATDPSRFGPADRSGLYLNRGDGTFEDGSDLLPASFHDGYTFVVGWHDLDGDGWPDLYAVNDFGVAWPNVVLLNRGGALVEAGAEALGLNLPMTGMGLGVGDLTGDGLADLVVPEWGRVRLLSPIAVPDQGWLYVDAAAAAGLALDRERGQVVPWGAELADLDADGELDAVLALGRVRYVHSTWANPDVQPDGAWRGLGAGRLEDVSAAWGLDDPGVGRGLVVADLNRDGWLDLVKRDLDGPDRVHLARCGEGTWLVVQLEQPGLNRYGVGAQLTLAQGGRSQQRTVLAGGTSLASAGPPEVHFGLGPSVPDTAPARLTIRWPDGLQQVIVEAPRGGVLRVSRVHL